MKSLDDMPNYKRDFWHYIANRTNVDSRIVLKGKFYVILPDTIVTEQNQDHARFLIRFLDGRIVYTTSLRSHGEIPKEYIETLPENAIEIVNPKTGKSAINNANKHEPE